MSQSVPMFSAKVDNVNTFASLLRAIAFTDKVNVRISASNGIYLVVEEGKYVQAKVHMKKELFQQFSMDPRDGEICFKVVLRELLDFLKIFCAVGTDNRAGNSLASDGAGVNTPNKITFMNQPLSTLKLEYKEVGGPFTLILDEVGTSTDFHVKTEEHEDVMDLEDLEAVCALILKSEPMKDIFSEIESNGPETLHIKLCPRPNGKLQLGGSVIAGEMKITIPEDALGTIEEYVCDTLQEYSFRFSVLRHSFRALNISEKVALKFDSNGTLILTFLINQFGTELTISFYCLPQIVDEENAEFTPADA